MTIEAENFWIMSDHLYKEISINVSNSDDVNRNIILEELYMAQYIEESNEHLISPTLHELLIPYLDEIHKDEN